MQVDLYNGRRMVVVVVSGQWRGSRTGGLGAKLPEADDIF